MWAPLFFAVFVVWFAIVGATIILQRRSAAATLAWLFALAFLPVVGLVVYRLIGPLRLERKRMKRTISRRAVREVLQAQASLADDVLEHQQLAHIGVELGEASALRAGEVELFFDGDSAYSAILAAVAGAQKHVHLEYYIWEPDTIGTQLRDALIERRKAGVSVRMVVDATGSSDLKKKWLAPLLAAGVEFAVFNPVRLRTLRVRRPDFRTHRKIVVVDGVVGFTGGMNITDDHSESRNPTKYWRDTHLRITGAAVWPLQRMFMEDWYFAAEELCPINDETYPAPTRDGEHLVQIIGSGPDSAKFAIHKMFFTICNQARERLWLTTPYFVPDEPILLAITNAALRDVDVRLIVPKHGDSRLVDMAARSYFPELLEAGVRIYEYESRFIHAKTIVCDQDISVVGTANLDNRSFRLNFEVAAIVFGDTANTQLAHAFLEDLKEAREVIRSEFDRQPLKARLGQASARLISPLL
ncbi:MAG TPA: cardiolipin synthase [Kofleriaceae bacterium]